jgi:hypothetical protein
MTTKTEQQGYEGTKFYDSEVKKRVSVNTNAPYLRGQVIPHSCPFEMERDYLVKNGEDARSPGYDYCQLKEINEYKDSCVRKLVSCGYKYIVSIIDPLDEVSYRECGASIKYQGRYIIAYMLIEHIAWKDSARLFFFENFNNLPYRHQVDGVTHFLKIPGLRKKKEIETDGGYYSARRSKLEAYHTFAVEDINNLNLADDLPMVPRVRELSPVKIEMVYEEKEPDIIREGKALSGQHLDLKEWDIPELLEAAKMYAERNSAETIKRVADIDEKFRIMSYLNYYQRDYLEIVIKVGRNKLTKVVA